jgi:hypothetical protein
MRIRTRLLLLILSILLPAFVVGSVAVWYVYQEQRKVEVAGMKETVRALALLADRELLAMEAVLRTLAASPAMQRGDLREFYEQARRVASPEHSAVVVSDAEGRPLINTRQPFDAAAPQAQANLMELRRAHGADGLLVSDLFISAVSKRPDIAVQIPVFIDGRLRYYVAMGMAADRLVPLLVQQGLPGEWTATLADRQGLVIARSRDAEKFTGQPVRAGLRTRILAGESAGMHQGVTLSGMPTVAFFSRAPLSDWTVVLSVPQLAMRQPAMYAAAGSAVLLLVILGLAIVGAHWYALRTAAPIERLRRAATALGRGDEVTAFVSGTAEADAVSAALAQASGEIRNNKAELERQVAEAVATAERAQRALRPASRTTSTTSCRRCPARCN